MALRLSPSVSSCITDYYNAGSRVLRLKQEREREIYTHYQCFEWLAKATCSREHAEMIEKARGTVLMSASRRARDRD